MAGAWQFSAVNSIWEQPPRAGTALDDRGPSARRQNTAGPFGAVRLCSYGRRLRSDASSPYSRRAVRASAIAPDGLARGRRGRGIRPATAHRPLPLHAPPRHVLPVPLRRLPVLPLPARPRTRPLRRRARLRDRPSVHRPRGRPGTRPHGHHRALGAHVVGERHGHPEELVPEGLRGRDAELQRRAGGTSVKAAARTAQQLKRARQSPLPRYKRVVSRPWRTWGSNASMRSTRSVKAS